MWWRTPWLRQRWLLLGLALALLDAFLLVGAYNLFYWQRFNRWAGITPSIAAVA
jgi:hypothetical protein